MLTETEWDHAQQQVVMAWHQGDFTRAFSEIERVLVAGTDEMKGQSLIYRGMIRESQGALEDAKQDWTDALSYASNGSYARYVSERSLGEVCEKLGLREQAERWYRAALATCVAGRKFSGGLALKAFVKLKGPRLSKQDETLVVAVAKKSWKALDLKGKPDLTDLGRLAETLAKRASET
jgi:tetratricopeptide (TPR) repeat protein